MRLTSRPSELVPLNERYRWMVVCRTVITLLMVAVLRMDALPGRATWPVIVAAVTWLPLTALTSRLLRGSRSALATALTLTLLADGLILAAAWWTVGGPGNTIDVLVTAHVVGTTLLASFRTGVKIALWHSVIALLVLEAAAAGVFGAPVPVPERALGGYIGGLWLITMLTAAFAAVNERELRRRRYDSEALRRLGLRLGKDQPPADVLEALVVFACDEMLAECAAAIAYPNPGPGQRAGGFGFALDRRTERADQTTVRLEQGQDTVVRAAGPEPAAVLVRGLDPTSDPHLASLLPGARDLVLMPFAHEHVAGVLALSLRQPYWDRSSPRVERRLVAVMQHATTNAMMALTRILLSDRIRQAARTDALTGLANRGVFDAELTRAVRRSHLERRPFALIMVDLDHFKKLNDTHGHQAGDDVLRLAAAALKATCRNTDLAARYGGEEFAVIADCDTGQEADALAERIRTAIVAVDAPAAISASLGVAVCPADGPDEAAVVAVADAALYEAKRGGRNRVVAGRATPVEAGAARA